MSRFQGKKNLMSYSELNKLKKKKTFLPYFLNLDELKQ